MGGVIIDSKKLPRVARFDKNDLALIKDLNKVFVKHHIKGTVTRVEIAGDLPPRPPIRPPRHCFRVCVPGPDDRPICTWICY